MWLFRHVGVRAEFDAGKHSLSEVGMTTDDICSHPKFKDNVINTLFWQFCRWQMIDLHSFVGLIHEFPVYMMYHDVCLFFIFPPWLMTKESHIIMLAAEVNMQMVPSRRRKWRPTNWPRLDLCNFYQCPITIRNNEKSTKGAIFLQKIMHFDFDACRTCFHLYTVQPRKHQEMRFVADQTCWPRSKCWPRERVDTRWPGEPCSMCS